MATPLLHSISDINSYLLISGFGPVTRQKIKPSSGRDPRPQDLLALGVTLIVDATNVPRRMSMDGVEMIKVAVDDSERANLTPHFHNVADAIQRHRLNGGKILVHCAAGVSRSCALCLAFLVKYEDLTLRDAYILVRSRRSIVNPNNGFWRQLMAFETEERGEGSVIMRRGLSREFPDVIFAHLELG